MGQYWVKKPFTRKTADDGRAIMRVGAKVNIELRSDALELLQGGFICKDHSELPPAKSTIEGEASRKTKETAIDPAEQAQVEEFAKAAGFPVHGAWIQVNKRLATGMPFAQALADARRAQGLLTWKERIEEVAEALGEPEAELQAELTELAKTFKLKTADAIIRLKLARELKQEPAGVFALVAAKIERESMTPAEAVAAVRAAMTPKAEVPKLPAEIDPAGSTPAAVQAAVADKSRESRQEKRRQRKAQQTIQAPI